MGFFDLNIPYSESDKNITDKCTKKATRLKLAVKAMELGYSGVAYNHTIKGVMSELDRCSISLFPLSSILKLAPSLYTSVKLHRDLLNVPLSTPFRQYTRLTVVVDSSSQASALNSGNPILKSYDIVAVRPVNQNAFEQACQVSEVDLIAIDFSEKLPFRLKQPMVKAAIERGVYFEVTYSSLIMDAQVRRQMISNAKLLVDWTRGKNLIFSSAAPSVTELRGPHDVANLSYLLGISIERAKAAISKTSRSLLASALRKKQFYKEAIRVEIISSAEQFVLKGSGFDDWLKWDPISSGEGDLQLDDMAKSFCASSKASKSVKAIDFGSVIDSLSSHGLHIKDLTSGTKVASEPPDIGENLSAAAAAAETEIPIAVYGVREDSDWLNLPKKNQTLFIDTPEKDQTLFIDTPEKHQTLFIDTPEKHQTLSSEDSKMSTPTETLEALASAEEVGNHTNMIVEETKISNDSDVYSCPETEQQNFQLEGRKTISETRVLLSDKSAAVHTLVRDTAIASACSAVSTTGISSPFQDFHSSALQSERFKSINWDVPLDAPNVAANAVTIETDIKSKDGLSFAPSDKSLHEAFPEREQFRETGDGLVFPADVFPILEPYDEMQTNCANSVAIHEPLEDVATEDQMKIEDHTGMDYPSLHESLSEKIRGKQRNSHQALLFPFKRLLNPASFKKKARKLKNKSIITGISKLSG